MVASRSIFSLPVAAMLLAALSGYLGLPQLELLGRVAPDVVIGAQLAHPVLRACHEQRRATAVAGSVEAQQLEHEREAGKRALGLIGGAPMFAATTAPSLAPSTTSPGSRPPAIAVGESPPAAWVELATTPEMVKPPPGALIDFSATPHHRSTFTLICPRGPPALA
ncbi:MAG: hypothetical protein IT462_10900 [Planctomycetes bacterium]|nr:hypothetical protein [Planctomycetota bacterium]